MASVADSRGVACSLDGNIDRHLPARSTGNCARLALERRAGTRNQTVDAQHKPYL